MRILIICFLVWIGGCIPAISQSVEVKSGAHPTFDRLVFLAEQPESWTKKEVGRIVELSGNQSTVFQLERVFDLITRDRIQTISSLKTGELKIELACDCSTEIFIHDGSYVVVDISDRVDALIDQSLEKTGQSIGNDRVTKPVFPLVFKVRQNQESVRRHDVLETSTTHEIDSTQLRNRLSVQIANAASQGLLTPALKEPTGLESTVQKTEDPATNVEAFDLPTLDPELGVAARTSVEELSLLLSANNGNPVDGVCSPNFTVDISKWINGDNFSQSLGAIRASFSDAETGNFNVDDLALARHYLAFGFGSEAKTHLSQSGQKTKETEFLSELAQFFAAPSLYDNQFFRKFLECDNDLVLWTFLTASDFEKLGETQAHNMIKSFRRLPEALQSHLAPKMTTQLASFGASDIANIFADVSAKAKPSIKNELLVVKSQIAFDENNPIVVENSLNEVNKRNDQTAVDAFIQRVKLDLSRGQRPTVEDIALIDSYAREYRQTEKEAELRHLAAMVRIVTGDISNGIELFENAGGPTEEILPILTWVAEKGSIEEALALAANIQTKERQESNFSSIRSLLNKRLRLEGFGDVALTPNEKPALGTVIPDTSSVPINGQNQTARNATGQTSLGSLQELRENLASSQELRQKIEADLSDL